MRTFNLGLTSLLALNRFSVNSIMGTYLNTTKAPDSPEIVEYIDTEMNSFSIKKSIASDLSDKGSASDITGKHSVMSA